MLNPSLFLVVQVITSVLAYGGAMIWARGLFLFEGHSVLAITLMAIGIGVSGAYGGVLGALLVRENNDPMKFMASAPAMGFFVVNRVCTALAAVASLACAIVAIRIQTDAAIQDLLFLAGASVLCLVSAIGSYRYGNQINFYRTAMMRTDAFTL